MLDQKLVEELKNAPLLLLAVKDKEVIDYFNNLIPYSTGFEIECNQGANYDAGNFRAIPDIMDVCNDQSEQRYRIPSGIKGMICLYFISIQLKLNSELNLGSGIHYHIDCTECFTFLSDKYNNKIPAWVLNELDTWGYTGTYNHRSTNWVRFNSLRTMEFRIGEMTFDYPLLLKRIIHCNSIVRRLKDSLNLLQANPIQDYQAPDAKKILEYDKLLAISNLKAIKLTSKLKTLNNELEELNKSLIRSEEEISIRNRIHKIG